MANIDNSGIWIASRGKMSAGAVAVGTGAYATNTSDSVGGEPSAFAVVDARLAELIDAIRQMGDQIDDSDELVDTAERARAELAGERPNRHVLQGLLAGLAGGLAFVSNLADSVASIQESVTNML